MVNIKKQIAKKWAHVPKTRKFNGKTYRRGNMPNDSKSQAKKGAQNFRDMGQLARVVNVGGHWWVYRRIPEHLRMKGSRQTHKS